MEFKVWVDGIERVICGVTSQTTCRDIVLCLAQATQQFGKFVLIEKWRQNERLLAPNELPIQILNKWGDLSNEVCFIMRRSDLHQQIQQQLQQHQQQQQHQQFVNNEPLYSTVRPTMYTNPNILHPINQMNQLNQINQLNQLNQLNQMNQMTNPLNQQITNAMNNQLNGSPMNQLNNQLNAMNAMNQQINLQPVYYQQTANQLQPNNMIYKQNVMKPNFTNSQQEYTNQAIYTNKYATQPPQHINLNQQYLNQPQSILHVQPNVQNKQLLTIHQHSPHGLQQQASPLNQVYGQVQRPINMQPQQYSPNVIKLNGNLMSNQQMMTAMNQLGNVNQQMANQLIQPQYVCRQDLIGNESLINRPKCPPPYKEAITKSALIQNNSPVNTSQSPSIYQQDYSSQSQTSNKYPTNQIKLNSVISHPNLTQVAANRTNSTPSPNHQIIKATNSQPNLKPETYYHVSVQQLKSKFDNNALEQKTNLNVKTLDKKNSESNFLHEKENRNAKHLNAICRESKETTKHSNLPALDNCDEMSRSDYQINNYQTEQLEALQKETERIENEKNQIANNINETDLKIAKCRQKIQILMDEIKDMSFEKETEKQKIEEDITLQQIDEIKQKIVQSIKEYESSSEKLNKLQNELDKLENALNDRKKMIEELTTDIKNANIEGLTLVPLEDQNGNLVEDENKPPVNENCELNENRFFNIRLGSTRRCLKISNDGELPVQTFKHPNGVWV